MDLLGGGIPYGGTFGEGEGWATVKEYAEYLEGEMREYEGLVRGRGERERGEGGVVLDVEEFVSLFCGGRKGGKEGEGGRGVPLYIFDGEVLGGELKDDFSPFLFMEDIKNNWTTQQQPNKEEKTPNHDQHQKFPQFALGGIGSGSPMHMHCDAINGLVFGEKVWFLLPPSSSFYSKSHPSHWLCDMMEEEKKRKKREAEGKEEGEGEGGVRAEEVMMCLQGAGEAMFVPRRWGHSTLNILNSVGIAIEYSGFGMC